MPVVFTCETWLMNMWDAVLSAVTCVGVTNNMSHINMSLPIYVPWRIHTCDMTHEYVYLQNRFRVECGDMCTHIHMSFSIYIYMWWHMSICQLCLFHCVCHDVFTCEETSELVSSNLWWVMSHICGYTCQSVSFNMCDMTCSHVWHDSRISLSTGSLVYAAVTNVNASLSICLPWLVHTRDMTHVHVYLRLPWCVQWSQMSFCRFEYMCYVPIRFQNLVSQIQGDVES